MPKWGVSKGEYFFNKDRGVIAKGVTSIKYLSAAVAEELYELSQSHEYSYFMDLLRDMKDKTSIDARQLEILIKLDFFSDFGNQRELMRMSEIFADMFKYGAAKQIKKASVDGTPLEPIVKANSIGTTKSGADAKSYTLLNIPEILHGIEDAIRELHMEDLSDVIKVQNFRDVMGYAGYVSGKEEDRRKLYVTGVKPLLRKSDSRQFGYSVFTKSIGSGKETRFTVFNRVFNKEPINVSDIVYCIDFSREGEYFTLNSYRKILA